MRSRVHIFTPEEVLGVLSELDYPLSTSQVTEAVARTFDRPPFGPNMVQPAHVRHALRTLHTEGKVVRATRRDGDQFSPLALGASFWWMELGQAEARLARLAEAQRRRQRAEELGNELRMLLPKAELVEVLDSPAADDVIVTLSMDDATFAHLVSQLRTVHASGGS